MSNSKDTNKKSDSVCAVIPFFNEKETLNIVLNESLKYVDFIFAVNDGSFDDKYQDERKKNNLRIIDLEKNHGKGKALNVGFESAISANCRFIVTLDADLQHEPKYIPDLLSALSSFDIVVGNRMGNIKGMPVQRILSNKITSSFLSIKTGQHILDSQSGFRAFRRIVLEEIKIKNSGFEAESEMLVKAAKKNFKIGFVNIPTIYRNEKSKMKPIQAIIGFLRVLFSNYDN